MELKKKDFQNKITEVAEGSIAEELGIEPGDVLIRVNGEKIEDIMEYDYLTAEDYVELEIQSQEGEVIIFEIDKEVDEEIGILFSNPIIDSVKTCRNNCVFCFIDQLPDGMRDTLYIKDDDSRLSFLQGNFITMTNMGEKEIEKMIRYRISPVNISVHTTNPLLRQKMLGNRFAGDIFPKIKRLQEGNIQMNGQIVLVPGVNDGHELEKTISDLASAYPAMNSLAVVPIGITKYRQGLCPVDTFDKQGANRVIDQVCAMQEIFMTTLGTRFVFLSDEFYVMAERDRPKEEDYEGYIQLENGVGLLTKMEREFTIFLEQVTPRKIEKQVSIATGSSAYRFICGLADQLMNKFAGLTIRVYAIENRFFGKTITVAGLLTAQDLISQLEGCELGEELFIPRVMMKADEDIFLDDMTLEEFADCVKTKVTLMPVDGEQFIRNIIKEQ